VSRVPRWSARLWLAAVLGCAAPSQEHAAMTRRPPDVLLQLIPPRGSDPLPPELATAEAQFTRATANYEAGRFAEAARGFLEAARALRLGGPYADGFTGNRRYCYRNAASALAAAAQEDPACADTLGELQAQLAPL
jgi:hypothetical protein